MKTRMIVVVSLVVILLASVVNPARSLGHQITQEVASSSEIPALFKDANAARTASEAQDISIRERYVTVNVDALWHQHQSIEESSFSREVLLNLFEDVTIKSIMQRVDIQQGDSFIWFGVIENKSNSQVIISMKSGILSASISLEDMFFRVRFVNQNVYVISQVDLAAPRPRIHSITPQQISSTDAPITTGASPAANVMPDDGSIITVMILYTSSARTHAGGVSHIKSLINLAIAETNIAYARSGVNQRLQLVYTGEIGYKESSNVDTDLDRLQESGDGYLDSVQQLRNTYMADLVNLVVNFGGKEFCGVAFGNDYSPTNRGYGYSVIALGCLNGPVYGFGHELGHNMGLAHDRANADGTPALPYAYGYQDPAGDFGDIMSYSCEGRGRGCPTIMNFSNPEVLYNGKPTGVDYRAPNAADAARALNKTAKVIANFRSQDHTIPSGTILSPSDNSTSHSEVFHMAADVQDNPGGSGVFSVTYWALYDGRWFTACTSTEPPFACTWVIGSNIKDQKITFAMHVLDYADNEAIDAGGYRSVLLTNVDRTNDVFLAVVRK